MARPRKWSLVLLIGAGGQLAAAIGLFIVGYFLLDSPDPKSPIPTGSPHRQILLLSAIGAVIAAELWFMMALVRRYFSFFTTVSIAGCGIGSMALVIVLSVMSGFESDLQEKILGFNAHLLVTKEDGDFAEYREVQRKIETVSGVVAQTPFVTSEVVIAANNNYANVIIKGIDPQTVSKVTDLEKNVKIKKKLRGKDRSSKQRRTAQGRAMRALWPLYEDGGVRSGPIDAGVEDAFVMVDDGGGADATDPAPKGFDVNGIGAPPDLSGGELPPDAAPVVDHAPGTLDVDDMSAPVDLTGGMTDDAILDAGVPSPDANPGFVEADFDIEGIDPGAFHVDIDDDPPPPRIPPRIALLPGILVGQELVKQIHLYTGQEVRVVSPLGEDGPHGPIPRTRFYRVAGKFFTGMYEYDLKFVYVDMKSLQTFLNLGDEANGIEIRVEDPDSTEPVAARVRELLGDEYRVQDWKELNRNLFSALKLEKIAMFLVLAIIILVASFSIIGNLIMVVVEKAKEIALMKTLGSSNWGVMQIFIAQGFFIGFVGTTLGVAHGLILSYLGGRFGLPLDPDVYYIDRLPIHTEGSAVLAVLGAGLLISVLATIYPAYVAARLRPSEGMRYE